MKRQKTNLLKKFLGYGLVFVVLLGSVGCGGSYKASDTAATESVMSETTANGSFNYYSHDGGFTEEVAEEEIMDADYKSENGEAAEVKDTARKLIKTVDMNVETQDFEGLMPLVEQKISALGGYIENSDVYNGSTYKSYKELRWASLTIRIPQDNLEEFIQNMQGVSNVTNLNRRVEDVTLTYVDLESHKKALVTEQDRLLELLEVAETVDDIITIENRLSQVRYQIESMEAQLRSYDNKVNYSTVYMNIDEVEILTPVVEETPGERIVRGFTESVKDVINGFKEFFIELIIGLPYLVVWGIIVTVIIFVIIKLSRRSMRKAEKQKYMAQAIQNIEKAEENDNKGI